MDTLSSKSSHRQVHARSYPSPEMWRIVSSRIVVPQTCILVVLCNPCYWGSSTRWPKLKVSDRVIAPDKSRSWQCQVRSGVRAARSRSMSSLTGRSGRQWYTRYYERRCYWWVSWSRPSKILEVLCFWSSLKWMQLVRICSLIMDR